jgi:ketosteroid isomerase-like protein
MHIPAMHIPAMRDHAADIRALRRQSNAAIAALDAQYVVSFMDDDVTVAVAGGPVLTGRAANRAAFAQQMADPRFGGYVRTPGQIIVLEQPLRATERGQWKARWRVRGRVHEQDGHYTAEWRHSDMGWLITAETYTNAAR